MTKKEKFLKAINEGKITDEKTAAVFVMVEELNERLDNEIPKITDVISRMKGDPGHTPTDKELIALIKPLIPEPLTGEDGHTPTDAELLNLIKPLIPKIQDGKTPTKKELLDIILPLIPQIDTSKIALEASNKALEAIKPLIPDITQLEDRLPQIGEKIRDSLELLQDDERLDISAIKGLEDYDKLNDSIKNPASLIGHYGVGGSTARNFYQLKDVPQSYASQAGLYLRVKSTEDGLEYFDLKDYIDTAVSGENLFDVNTSTRIITPHTAGDNLDMGTGTITGSQSTISKLADGADVNLILRNTAGSGSTDETVSILAQTKSVGEGRMGSIVFGRADDYSGTVEESSFMDFYVENSQSPLKAMRLDNNGNINAYASVILGTMTLAQNGVITDSSGAISFDNENLLTTGTLGAGAITGTSLSAGSGTITTTGLGTFGTLLVTEASGTDLPIILRNTEGTGSSTGAVTIYAQTNTSQVMGKIVFDRYSDYSAGDQDSNMKFYVAYQGTDTLALTLDTSLLATFAGGITAIGTGTFGQIIDNGLTNENVVYVNSSKQLIGSANLNFDGTNFSIGNIATSWLFAVKGATNGLIFNDVTTSMDFIGYNGAAYNNICFRTMASATRNQLYLHTGGNIGFGTTAPDRHLEINTGAATGGIRLTYNDANGSATIYGDFLIDSAGEVSLHSTGGLQIGTATTELIGFYGVTPVDQPATVADAATQDITGTDTVDKTKVTNDLTSCKNAINSIIDRLQELGLIA